jgi:hypothetical protein
MPDADADADGSPVGTHRNLRMANAHWAMASRSGASERTGPQDKRFLSVLVCTYWTQDKTTHVARSARTLPLPNPQLYVRRSTDYVPATPTSPVYCTVQADGAVLASVQYNGWKQAARAVSACRYVASLHNTTQHNTATRGSGSNADGQGKACQRVALRRHAPLNGDGWWMIPFPPARTSSTRQLWRCDVWGTAVAWIQGAVPRIHGQ